MSLPMVKKIKAKIDQLNNDSWAARVSNSVQALELSKEAVELSRSITYKKGLADLKPTTGNRHCIIFSKAYKYEKRLVTNGA
jgi:hypothetical protein